MFSTAIIDVHITLVTFFLKLKCEKSKQMKKILQNKLITSNTYGFISVVLSISLIQKNLKLFICKKQLIKM